jgi:hypothetical protein
MAFLGGLAKLGAGALNLSAKVAGKAANVTGKAATKIGSGVVKIGDKMAHSRAFVKNATPKKAESLSFVDKKFQEATGIAKKGADGAMQYKTVTGGGFMALAAIPMIGTTGQVLSGASGQSARGMVSVADGMDRFISYDGSGFVNNAADVAGGNPEILGDIANHAFTSQRSIMNNNLNDIVFALHANREG